MSDTDDIFSLLPFLHSWPLPPQSRPGQHRTIHRSGSPCSTGSRHVAPLPLGTPSCPDFLFFGPNFSHFQPAQFSDKLTEPTLTEKSVLDNQTGSSGPVSVWSASRAGEFSGWMPKYGHARAGGKRRPTNRVKSRVGEGFV